MGVLLSKAEFELLDEITNLGHGRLEHPEIPAQERTERRNYMDKRQHKLIKTLREFQYVETIIIQDGFPIYVEVKIYGKFGKAIKRIRLDEA